MTTQLKCAECTQIFEVSTETAEAMRCWREASGEPIICGECAGVDAIILKGTAPDDGSRRLTKEKRC